MRVALLAYEGCLASELFAVRDLLVMADRLSDLRAGPRLQVSLRTAAGGEVEAAGGARLASDPDRGCDLLVVPGFDFTAPEDIDGRLAALGRELDDLQSVRSRSTPVASVCVGAFLLGATGILDGRRATTAWAFADDLAARCPNTTVDRTALLVEDDGVTTCGAFTAANDLALHLVERYLGAQTARATRNLALIESGRSSQAPFLDGSLLPSRRRDFSDRVERWLLERLAAPYALPALAEAVGASSRTLLRRYKAERGRTPLEFLQGARIERAKRLLESTALSIPEITHQVGYEDLSAFRELFARLAGSTPGAYRRRFADRS